MTKIALVALGFAAVLAAAPASAECPGHTGTTAQQSTPASVAQTTVPASVPAEEDQVILTQNEAAPEVQPPSQ